MPATQRALKALACALRLTYTALPVLALILILSACGSGPVLMPATQPSQPSTPAGDVFGIGHSSISKSVTPVPEADITASIQLPALDELTAPLRQLSSSTYGFQPVNPSQPLHSANTAPAGNNLSLNPAGGVAFAVYGLGGFKADSYPVSARLRFADETGEYFIGFPDYSKGRWQLEGPFSGDAEIGIVLRGQPNGYRDFIGSGNSYFALIFPADNNGGFLEGVDFGVNGGTLAPGAPTLTSAIGGDVGVLLQWVASKDSNDADFAGYIVERAPQFDGDFVPLSAAPTTWLDYFDDTTTVGSVYRYRVFAVDTSNNRSAPASVQVVVAAGTQLPPVPRLRLLSKGPYLSPVNIAYDMSESYDPEGEALFDHAINSITGPVPLATGESGSLSLGAGAYLIILQVSAGTRTGDALDWVTVYPQWESSSTVVRPSDPGSSFFPRLARASVFKLPGDPEPWLCGFDYCAVGMSFIRPDGSGVTHHRLGFNNFLQQVGRPLVSGNGAFLISRDVTGFTYLSRFNGISAENLSILDQSEYYSVSQLAGTPNPDTVQTFTVFSEDGVNYGLKTQESTQNSPTEIAPSGVANNSPLAALYNSAADRYDLFLVAAGSTGWVRWNKQTNMFEANFALIASSATSISAAVNPVSGHPAVAYFVVDTWYFRQYDGAAWSAAETINGTPNEDQGQLVFLGDRPFLLAAESTGQLVLHERSGPATWTERNRPASAAMGSGISCGLMPGDTAGELLAIDSPITGTGRRDILYSLLPGDVDSEIFSLPGVNLPAYEFDASAAADGLHVTTRVNVFGDLEHWRSPDGSSWTSGVFPDTITNHQLGSNLDGDLYLGGYKPATNTGELYWWDQAGTSWMDEGAAIPVTLSDSIVLSTSSIDNHVQLYGFDGAGPQMRSFEGNHTDGYGGFFSMTSVNYFRGTATQSLYYGISGMASEQEGEIRLLGSGPEMLLFDPIAEDQFGFMSQLLTGRMSYASGFYLTRNPSLFSPFDQRVAFCSTYGSILNPARAELTFFLANPTVTDLDFASGSVGSFILTDNRRTVSMMTTSSANLVSLIATLDGSNHRFEWTGEFGWEALPLPQIERMMAPKLFQGRDGRWHILYYDWETDELLLRSTL
jgi:hypothetical protein